MSQDIETEVKTCKTKRRPRSNQETTPPLQHIKENTPPCNASGPWTRPQSTPCGHPRLQHRRKALTFIAASPQLKSPSTNELPAGVPFIEQAVAGKQLTERQQMSLLLQLTSNSSAGQAAGGRGSVSVSRRKAKVNWKVKKRNERGETPLHVASKKGDVGAVGRLIREGAEINGRDYAGWTPLHEAAISGHPSIVAKLLKHGADPNASGMDNDSPLHDAAANSHREVVQILLKNGAICDQRNMTGELPIDVATDESIILVLKQHMSGVTQVDEFQEANTSNNFEQLFLPIDESMEMETTNSHEVKEQFGEITSPDVSPILSKGNFLPSDDIETFKLSASQMEGSVSCEEDNSFRDSCEQVNHVDDFEGSTSLGSDTLICREEIHLDSEPQLLALDELPSAEIGQLSNDQTDQTILGGDGLSTTRQMDLSDCSTTVDDTMMSHVEDKLVSDMDSTMDTRDEDNQDSSEPKQSSSHSDENQDDEGYTMCDVRTQDEFGVAKPCQVNNVVPNSSPSYSEIQQDLSHEANNFDSLLQEEELRNETSVTAVKGKKQILYNWRRHCDTQKEDTIATQPPTTEKGNTDVMLPPGFKCTLTHTKMYTLQTAPLENPEQCFFESLFPPRETPGSLRLKHRIEKEKLLLAFEQQVLYAVDQCHIGPKPITFCGLLATKEGWHLATRPSETNETDTFKMDKYTELLQSIQDNYDKATLQLARRHQLELETLWACSSQQTRTILSSQLSDEGKLMPGREKFTM
ncbi:ankyrin repeat domain-containing protein 31-like isoform X2 [Corticium candelabrum]|uniref:ankyrin repeat domain-containing protein 31-like isoform X2 n=1 Tax=Corticium candelabrum TaxID=121492 RepID=UPI002E252309|nr:ankyrin repeat domain-containing protein 31-like isoform X2 [Corticium candelabrum]